MSLASTLPFSRLNRQVVAIGIADALVYRGSLFLHAFFQLFPLVTMLLLWSAIYKSGGADLQPGGFSANSMLSYYLLVNILRLVTYVEDVSFNVTQEIRDGTLNKYLIRPVNYLLYHWHLRMGQVAMAIVLLTLPSAVLLLLARTVLVVPEEGWRWGAFVLSFVLGIQIGFLISFIIGLCAFWLLETSAFLHAMYPIQLVLSGWWFPLELLPPKLFTVLNALPWAYQSYFSMRIYLGKIGPTETIHGLVIQIGWVLGLWLLALLLWRRGLHRYAAVGG